MTLIERRNSMEYFRDQAADHFARYTGSHWHPRSGSMVNHRALTSAVIDSRDFLAAKRRAETEVLLPAGPKIAFTGGLDFNDHRLIRQARSGPRQASRHGAAARRFAERRRAYRRPLGRPPQGATNRLQAGLDQTRQGGTLQAQRSDARRAADRRHGIPRHRHSREPGRQGTEARHPRLEIRQWWRVGATLLPRIQSTH